MCKDGSNGRFPFISAINYVSVYIVCLSIVKGKNPKDERGYGVGFTNIHD